MDDARITAAGNGDHAAGRQDAQAELFSAAEAALAWLDRFDAHAPEGLVFGGEAKVRRQLREAIRRARAEAENGAFADARDAEEAQALDGERARLGRAPTERERAAFLGGFRRRGWSTRTDVSQA